MSGFASETPSIAAGVSGDGAAPLEPVRVPLINAHVIPEHGEHRPSFQVPIFRTGWRRAKVVGTANAGDSPRDIREKTEAPEHTRKLHRPSLFDSRMGLLAGSIFETIMGRGVELQPASERDKRDVERGHITGRDDQWHTQPIRNRSTFPGGAQDDITKNLAPANSEPHAALISARANWPFLKIKQFPAQTRTIPLAHGVASEIVLPDIAVFCRFVAPSGVDIWWSLQGAARIPTPADMGAGNTSINAEGMVLNLDPTADYYTKGIKSVSAISAVDTFVNVQAYVSA